jgi:AcrR family transcriptional regulator
LSDAGGSGGAADTRALRRAATRSRILEAAWRLARRNGLAALTVRDLAAEVNMRAPSLYWYFSSKNDIYDAMYAEGLRQLAKALDECPTSPDPIRTLKRRERLFVHLNTYDPCRYQLIFQRPIPGFVPTPESFAIGVEGFAKHQAVLEAVGVRGDRAHDLWRAVINGLIGQQIANDPGGNRWTRLVDEAVDLLVAHYAHRSPVRSPRSRSQGARQKGKP